MCNEGTYWSYLSSPTIINGSFWLNAMQVNLTDFRGTTCWTHIALYLFTLISKTYTFPSVVTAARTVLEYGAHLTSPTLAPRSNINNGSLWIEGEAFSFLFNFDIGLPPHIFPNFDAPISATRNENIRIEFVEINFVYRQVMGLIGHQIPGEKETLETHGSLNLFKFSFTWNWMLYYICRSDLLPFQLKIFPVVSDGISYMYRMPLIECHCHRDCQCALCPSIK